MRSAPVSFWGIAGCCAAYALAIGFVVWLMSAPLWLCIAVAVLVFADFWLWYSLGGKRW